MEGNAPAVEAGSKALKREILIAALTAAASCLATLGAQGAYSFVYGWLFPSPYHYLEGVYSGHWEWTDQNHKPQQTDDTVFFVSTVDGKLVGRGSDPKLGAYVFDGTLTKNHVSAAYRTDEHSAQPAQSGGFELDVLKSNPLTLKGNWTGFYDRVRIEGPVVLTKKPD